MALEIEGASIGYDSNNLQSTLMDIHTDCIIKAQNELRTNLKDLNDALNECWVGVSADNFKSNMEKDVEGICKGLESAYNDLVEEFKGILAELAKIDEELVTKR